MSAAALAILVAVLGLLLAASVAANYVLFKFWRRERKRRRWMPGPNARWRQQHQLPPHPAQRTPGPAQIILLDSQEVEETTVDDMIAQLWRDL